jgi:hypothetical protein
MSDLAVRQAKLLLDRVTEIHTNVILRDQNEVTVAELAKVKAALMEGETKDDAKKAAKEKEEPKQTKAPLKMISKTEEHAPV